VMAGRRAAAQGEKGLRSQEYWNVTIKFKVHYEIGENKSVDILPVSRA